MKVELTASRVVLIEDYPRGFHDIKDWRRRILEGILLGHIPEKVESALTF